MMRVKRFFWIIFFYLSIFPAYASSGLSQQIVQTSAQFLDVPYQFEPLGEGKQGEFNREPLYRNDRFDCQTYVDTVLALAIAHTKKQPFLPIFLRLQYKNGQVNFTQRNHFPEINWLPNNIAEGLIKNITSTIASPQQMATATVTINLPGWYQHLSLSRIHLPHASLSLQQKKLQQLEALSANMHPQIVMLSYIRKDAVPDILSKMPDGAIILLVSPSSDKQTQHLGTAMLISHMGFAVWKKNKLYLRAASSLYGEVIDLPLLPYLQHESEVKGIMVIEGES